MCRQWAWFNNICIPKFLLCDVLHLFYKYLSVKQIIIINCSFLFWEGWERLFYCSKLSLYQHCFIVNLTVRFSWLFSVGWLWPVQGNAFVAFCAVSLHSASWKESSGTLQIAEAYFKHPKREGTKWTTVNSAVFHLEYFRGIRRSRIKTGLLYSIAQHSSSSWPFKRANPITES